MKEKYADVIEYVIGEIINVYDNQHPTASGEFDEFFHEVINIIRNTEGDGAKKWNLIDDKWHGQRVRVLECTACGMDIDVANKTIDEIKETFNYCPCCGFTMKLEEK